MGSLSATGFSPKYPVPNHTIRRRSCCRLPAVFAALKASPPPVNEFAGDDDVLRAFLKEREMSRDFVSRLCDELWLRGGSSNLKNNENSEEGFDSVKLNDLKISEEENEGGFLKLKRTGEWLSGDDESAPMNKKISSKKVRDDSQRRKRLNFLRYEALKRELLFLTVGVGTACSGYCLVTFSVQAAVSYATGVLFRIGIRSEDLQDSFEKTLKGSSIALSSPRLVFPAAIYGIWELSQHFAHDIFDFQLVPAMMGLFAYKAAALVQVYRDNEDLQFIFPENADGSTD
ncbi:NAD(P)-binding Rossmann-fold superfamily protein [Striga asiatica]|uniref:NAD(P)-binding Rossmann-fold superfamily protein n=1 Tax=Striga asiatica TaxID=4170 RepID=A0A5A7R6M1_STRAF|nr:NAD(P)-binding Rossmann-fold superfamily protein [Striga asiatica]